MGLLQLREKRIFETLRALSGEDFVVIGGYAVNAYTFPRFSLDCDIVVKDKQGLGKIGKLLQETGYSRVSGKTLHEAYGKGFERYEQKLAPDFKVSIDILVGEVFDRQSGASFSAEWVFKNSKMTSLRGKTIAEKVDVRVVNIDALLAMKIACARASDIRDVFMLAPQMKDRAWVRKEISERCGLEERLSRVKEKVASRQFRDGLQGVFGHVEERIFEKHMKLLLEI